MAGAANGKQQRAHSRLEAVLDAGAELFASKGYKATTMRDIAAAAGMQPGSLYYHFASKQELLRRVYGLAVEQAEARLVEAIDAQIDPWERFEAAVVRHTETMLDQDNYAKVMNGVLPADAPELTDELTQLRDNYEAHFSELVAGLTLPADVDRKLYRLFVLGAINSSRIWYRPGGKSPDEIGRAFFQFLRRF